MRPCARRPSPPGPALPRGSADGRKRSAGRTDSRNCSDPLSSSATGSIGLYTRSLTASPRPPSAAYDRRNSGRRARAPHPAEASHRPVRAYRVRWIGEYSGGFADFDDAPAIHDCSRSQICATTARSWLIRRKVTPASRSRSLMRFSACACTETSSADTGSSATTSFGRVMSARAMAMRWRWPPENSCGCFAASEPRGRRPRGKRARGRGAPPGRSAQSRERLGDNFFDALARVERTIGVLEDHLHMGSRSPAVGARQIEQRAPLEAHRARVRPVQRKRDARERRLARAGFADDSERAPLLYREAHAGQRRARFLRAKGRSPGER